MEILAVGLRLVFLVQTWADALEETSIQCRRFLNFLRVYAEVNAGIENNIRQRYLRRETKLIAFSSSTNLLPCSGYESDSSSSCSALLVLWSSFKWLRQIFRPIRLWQRTASLQGRLALNNRCGFIFDLQSIF